ncbi:MAG: hypothetical protein CL695_00475 [Chloroflexi bacterium]|nr:hypothetical protein [Chloroflexota bacterium]
MTFKKYPMYFIPAMVLGLSFIGLIIFLFLPRSQPHNYPPEPFTPIKELMLWSQNLNSDFGSSKQAAEIEENVPTFSNIASSFESHALIENRYPGIAVFDFDRDGDMDFYVTSAEITALFQITRGGTNKFFENLENNEFAEIGSKTNTELAAQNSSAVAACDFNNDGFQDLYVGGHGRIGDGLDYRSIDNNPNSLEASLDRLLINSGTGIFEDVTAQAFGESANLRSTMSISCADVNNDGWIDIFVGNRADQDFVRFDDARHHGHYNNLYLNNGDLTFTDITLESGLLSPQIKMLDENLQPIIFSTSEGDIFEGFDPSLMDGNNRLVGDPAGQTWASMFFDYDDDNDQDLWIADDGDVLKIYRNDSSPEKVLFTPVAEEMGLDVSGQWMGFALGDYDSDSDLDVFITNMGFHRLKSPKPIPPGGDCAYSSQYGWGTCFHFMLRNDGNGVFTNVAAEIPVEHSDVLPPESLEPGFISSDWTLPEGIETFEFGFGAAFVDTENDGDEDLYWVGSLVSRGEGPGGGFAPAAGRLLQNQNGIFRDSTVEAKLLDILAVDYSNLSNAESNESLTKRRLGLQFHENGKGVAVGDLNSDGFTDLIVTNSNGETFDSEGNRNAESGPLFVWINSGSSNNWIKFKLKGRMAIDSTGSNADGVGAKILVSYNASDGQEFTQVKPVLSSASFLSTSSTELIFGLANANEIKEIIVYWPSGIKQVVGPLQINTTHEIVESE